MKTLTQWKLTPHDIQKIADIASRYYAERLVPEGFESVSDRLLAISYIHALENVINSKKDKTNES